MHCSVTPCRVDAHADRVWADSNGVAEFLQALRGRDRKGPHLSFCPIVKIDSEVRY